MVVYSLFREKSFLELKSGTKTFRLEVNTLLHCIIKGKTSQLFSKLKQNNKKALPKFFRKCEWTWENSLRDDSEYLQSKQNLKHALSWPTAPLTFSSKSAPEQWERDWFGYVFVCTLVLSSKSVVEIKYLQLNPHLFFTSYLVTLPIGPSSMKTKTFIFNTFINSVVFINL